MNDGDHIVSLFATRSRKRWIALIESADGAFRHANEKYDGDYWPDVTGEGAREDIATRIYFAKMDGHILRPIETSSAIV